MHVIGPDKPTKIGSDIAKAEVAATPLTAYGQGVEITSAVEIVVEIEPGQYAPSLIVICECGALPDGVTSLAQ